MNIYFEIIAAFIVLGAYVFGLFCWWYRHLISLADRYDVPERRKRAAIMFPVVILFVAAPVLAALFFSIGAIPRNANLGVVIVPFFGSLAPGVIWWCRRMPSLYALGYGRQR